MRIPWIALIGIVVVAVVGFFLMQSFGVLRPEPGRRVPESAVGIHVAEGQPVTTYNSTPPTSGPHWPSPAPWGVYDAPIPDERAVHNMEHGGVVISYNQLSPADVQKLKDIRATTPASRYGTVKVVIRPYDKIPAGTIALTAWGRIDTLQQADEQRIRAFIDAYTDRCCEAVP